ncbi:hypothetical protein CRM22_008258 [Opisthorchis felineus]|uniref:CCHC-type domain-containing protein n=1 Tax=Opisthorchis felineus TaxID=147828 RepID=A0A4S2LCR1_OPIFE|nr:hypothetical protein CRM22_008258 [Opisthorchis felineus]
MRIPWPQPFEDGDVRTFLEDFEDVAEAAGLETDRGKLAALKTLLRGRAKAALDAARRGPRKMDWAAAKEALAAEFDTPADRQEAMRRFKTASMGPGCDPTVFFASLQQLLDRALPELDGVSRQQLLSEQFVEGVHPALRAQLRLARATGQLSVEHLVHLARELAEAPLATLQSQENRDESTVEDLKNKVDQLAGQLAAIKTESRRHARMSRCYRCGMHGHWKNQCPHTRPPVHNKTLDYSSFPGWVAISAVTQATIQAVVEIDGKKELCLIDTGAGVSLRRRGNEAVCKPCALAVRAVGGYQLKIDGLSMHSMRLGDRSVQHEFLISPDIEQTILGADFLRGTESVVDLKRGKLVTKYGAVKLEGYPSTAVNELHVRKLPSCNMPSVQSVVEEYSELFTGEEDPFGFCSWIEHEIPLSSECFRPYGPRPLPLHLREEVHKQVQEMLKNGIIEEANSAYNSPVVFVKKANGKYRFCVDFWRLNELTVNRVVAVPSVADIFDSLQHFRYFTVFLHLQRSVGQWDAPEDWVWSHATG